MSLASLLVKGGSKALGYGKRIAKVTPEFLLGDSSEIIGRAMRAQKGSIWQKGKAGFKALESYNNAQTGNFFSRVVKNLKSTPKDLVKGFKVGARAGAMKGTSKILSGLKGTGKALVKKLPLVGAVLTVALELPNIVRAFKDGGFKAGMKEIGGAGVELGCMAGGAAIGSAICPGIGTAIGAVVGGIVGMFARGKTHSEKKAEEEAAQQTQPTKYTNEEKEALRECGFTDEEIQQLQDAGYTIQDVEQAIIKELEKQGVDVPTQDNTKTSLSDRLNTPYTKQASESKPKEVQKEATQVTEQPLELDTTQAYVPTQAYDPTQEYQYNNLDTVAQTGFTNPYATLYQNPYMNTNVGGKYANDIYFQQIFGPQNSLSNPFLQQGLYPQTQYYV